MANPCSARTEMEELLLGTLPEPAAQALTSHLEECGACLASMQDLRADDPLLRALRAQPGRLPVPANLDLLLRLKQLPFAESGIACSAHADTMPGTLGRYQLRKCLGAGGMGTVYEAFDPELKRTVAIKVPRLDRAEARQRFLREARSAAAIRHPHVCPVYDVGEQQGKPFVVMACIDGQSLADRLRQQNRYADHRQAVILASQMARALEAVHAHGIIHRDLKPGNILLDQSGQALLTDFGVAQVTRDQEALTADQQALGTLPYMAPEQLAENGQADARSDIYSLGVVLHQLLTGQLPGRSTPSSIRIDPGLQRILERMLANQPQDRHGSAAELANELERWLASAPSRRMRLGWLVPGLAAAALLAAVFVLSGNERETDTSTSKPAVATGAATPTIAAKPKDDAASFDAWVDAQLLLPLEKRIEPVSAKLRELNPGFDGTIRKTYEIGRLTNLDISTDQVSNIAPLRAFQGILRLACAGSAAGNGTLIDLRPLADMRLDTLNLSNNPGLRDLGPLADIPLVGLTLTATAVEDLMPLQGNSNLLLLNITSSRVRSLEALRGMKLRRLYAENIPIQDLTPLAGMPLLDVQIRNTRVLDLTPLRNLPLQEMSFDRIGAEEARILAGIPTLQRINGRPAQETLGKFKP